MKLSSGAEHILKNRYLMEWEEWEDCCKRVGRTIAQYESTPSNWDDTFSELIYNCDFIPGGRVLRNAGRPQGSLFNCFFIPVEDSIESIARMMGDCLKLWASGGGIGLNISDLRPEGDSIKGKGGESSGPVSFLHAADAVAGTIQSGGQRRAAAIAIMHCSHPDIIKFINAKLKDGILSNFNISVAVDEPFLEAVENDGDWTFYFRGIEYGKIKARKLWNIIVSNMLKSAEPGLINYTNLTRNNTYYFHPVQGVNPCSEACLGAWEACNLGSINLANFTTGKRTDWRKLEGVISNAIRFMDNVINSNRYELQEIERNAHNSRRIGLGTMGLGDYLFKKEIRYGSKQSIEEVERLYKFIKETAYESSIKLSEDRGTFPAFDKTMYCKADFVRQLPTRLKKSIKQFGIRNSTLLAQAPTGTISLIPEVTPGIEPLFSKAYKAEDNAGTRYYIHPLYKQILASSSDIPEWFVDAYDITPSEHFEVQVAIGKHTDASTSKTVNLPKSTKVSDLSDLLLSYIWDIKGTTVYVDGCRGNQPLSRIGVEEAKKHINEASHQDKKAVECVSGSCEL